MQKKVLITGSSGQLGRSVYYQLKSKYDLIQTDIINPNNLQNFEFLDISNKDQINSIISKYNPDIIVNLAAYTDVDGCELNPQKAEILNTKSIEYILETFDMKFIQISTDYVFDGKSGPYSEEDKTNPISIYGNTKLEAEKIIKRQSSNWCILRTNVLFDYYKGTEASFIKWVIDSLRNNKKINIVDDQWNNPTWTKNLSEVIELVIKNDTSGIYHYGGEDYLNRYDFALMIAEIFNLEKDLISPISTESLNQPASRPLNGGLKTERIEEKLKIKCHKLIDTLNQIKSRMD